MTTPEQNEVEKHIQAICCDLVFGDIARYQRADMIQKLALAVFCHTEDTDVSTMPEEDQATLFTIMSTVRDRLNTKDMVVANMTDSVPEPPEPYFVR